MNQEHRIPSESEWQIMEIIWQEGDGITSAEILKKLKGHTDMTERTIRVLLSRLCGKGLLTSIPDERDNRVLHYHASCDRDSCLKEKSRSFIDHYFGGSNASAIASFIGTVISFIITAFVLFLIIKAMNAAKKIGKKEEAPAAPTTKKCPFCQTEIDINATRCPHCTSELKE